MAEGEVIEVNESPAGGESPEPKMDIQVSGGPEPTELEQKAAAGPEAPEPKKPSEEETSSKQDGKNRLQRRFSELTHTIYEERARREALERELSELRGKAAPPQAPSGGDKPPKLEDYADYEQYADARARYVASQEIRRSQVEFAQRAQQERATQVAVEIRGKWDAGEAEARGKFEDYDEVMAGQEVKFSEATSIALLDSEIGPQLAYHLKTHPEEARNLAGLTPVAAARAIGKLEARLSATPAAKPKTAAPPPPRPLGGAAPAEGLSDKLDVGEWIKRRNKEVMERRRNG